MAENSPDKKPLVFNRQASGEYELIIYGDIAWYDNSAPDIQSQLSDMDRAEVVVRVNSLGGDVIEGTAIHSLLASYQGKVTIKIDGYAISMASVIAMAGDHVEISPLGQIMIHSPWSGLWGNAAEMRKEADLLDQFESCLIKAYQMKTGLAEDKLREMLAEETWLTAEQALELGFVDSIAGEAPSAKACFSPDTMGRFKNAPKGLESFLMTSEPDEPEEPEPPQAPETPVSPTEPAPVVDHEKRALGIIQACSAANLSHMAEKLIANKHTVESAKSILTEIKAGIEDAGPTKQQPTNAVNNSAGDAWAFAYAQAGAASR